MFTRCGGRNFQKAVFGMLIINYLNIMHKKGKIKLKCPKTFRQGLQLLSKVCVFRMKKAVGV